LSQDLRAAMKAKVPILKVDNVTDFSEALKELKERDINVNTYTLNSHGTGGNSNSPAYFYIGYDPITSNTDLTQLKEGLVGHNIFIGACNIGSTKSGESLLMSFAEQTKSSVIAAAHQVLGGYKYDGSMSLNPTFNNYKISMNGSPVRSIYDVRIDKNSGITWRFDAKLPFYFNIR